MRSHRFCTWQGAPPVIDKIEAPSEREPAKVINLMDALRRSVEVERADGKKEPAASIHQRSAKKKPARSSTRQKKVG